MNATAADQSLSVSSLSTLGELLDLLAQLYELDKPLNTPEGLRDAMEIVLELGTTIGLDSNWLVWLQNAAENPAIFNVVLAVVTYLGSVLEPAKGTVSTNSRALRSATRVGPQSIAVSVWLSLIAEIAQLIQKLRTN